MLVPIKPIFAGEIPGSLFVLGQHFGGPYGDPEKTLHDFEAGKQTGMVLTLSTFLLAALLEDPGV